MIYKHIFNNNLRIQKLFFEKELQKLEKLNMEDIIKKIASNDKFISHPIKCNLTNNRVNIVQNCV